VVVEEDDGVDAELALDCEEETEEASPHATRNNAAKADIVKACFLFMISPFLMNNGG
jgi:hypothetical protein